MQMLFFLLFTWLSTANAHGIWSHIHVTGWAIENLPDGEVRNFFDEPEVFQAALFGAAFVDSGYFPVGSNSDAARAFAEHSHWEPFVADYMQWIIENDPPPWNSLASRKRVGFLMGCASHGLQDEIFDTLFLPQVSFHDELEQEEADPGVDGFLALDDHLRFQPPVYLPMDVLLQLYGDLGHDIDAELIRKAVDVMALLYVNEENGYNTALGLGNQYAEVLTWTRLHYLDPEVPGSIRSEIFPTMHYIEALWQRLHQQLPANEIVAFAFPEAPRRLRSEQSGSADSWVSFIFTSGLDYATISSQWKTETGEEIPFTLHNTRWNHGWTRIVSLKPSIDLISGNWYEVTLFAQIDSIENTTSDQPYSFRFQVECSPANSQECPDLQEVPQASLYPPTEQETPKPKPQNGKGCTTFPKGPFASGIGLFMLLLFRRSKKPTPP